MNDELIFLRTLKVLATVYGPHLISVITMAKEID